MTDQVAETFLGLLVLLPTPGTESFFDRKAQFKQSYPSGDDVAPIFFLKNIENNYSGAPARIYRAYDPLADCNSIHLKCPLGTFVNPILEQGRQPSP